MPTIGIIGTGMIGPSITAGTVEEAASKDIVFLSVNWPKLQGVLAGLPDWNNRILIDTNNPMQRPPLPPIDVAGRVSSSIIQEWAPDARVVKAFNHHYFMNLEKAPDVPMAADAFCFTPAMTRPQRQTLPS